MESASRVCTAGVRGLRADFVVQARPPSAVLRHRLVGTIVPEVRLLHTRLAPVLGGPVLLHRFAGREVQAQVGVQVEARPGRGGFASGDFVAGVGAAHDVELAQVIVRAVAFIGGGQEVLLLAAILEPEINILARIVPYGQNRRPGAYC